VPAPKGLQLEQIKPQRLQTPHHLPVGELPEAEPFPRLLCERKHFDEAGVRHISLLPFLQLIPSSTEWAQM
jgi:hypothetical protein